MSIDYGPYPEPVPPVRPRKSRQALGLTATAVVALAAGAAVGTAVSVHSNAQKDATATSSTALSTSQIASRVDPGLVDVIAPLASQDATDYGTGIVLTSDGIVLTNNHVVEGASSVSVRDIGTGKTYKATVLGYDESHDVAVLKVSGASGLTTASLGNSSTVSVGNKVVGLGNAGGKDGIPSVAPGTVTALNQSITASDEASGATEQLTGMIESNAGIQAGDSGGPLVNSYGQVVGMDTAAYSGYQLTPGSGDGNGGNGNGYGGYGNGGNGYGGNGGNGFGGNGPGSGSGEDQPGSGSGSANQAYTIPIDTALSIEREITAGQGSPTVHVGSTAFLGIELSGESSSDGQGSGVTIAGVVSGTPAANAGLTGGDTITSLAGRSVTSGTTIQDILIGYHPGDKVTIAWINEFGQSQHATITLANGPFA